MIVYRLTKEQYKDTLSGRGAEINGGRWNNKGRQVIYTGESRALCTTEIAVHSPLGIVPTNYYLQSIQLPKVKMFKISATQLDKGWRNFPHEISTKTIGDNFIDKNQYLLMKVPSAVIQDEFNYLINPLHKQYSKVELVKVEEFKFDKRLFTK